MWTQPYMLLGLGKGLSAIVAALPILAVFLLLGMGRKPAWMAGTCGLVISLLVAVAACQPR
jgi:L-lactate permease